ncbi:MAG: hypothetical protein APR54_03825 [Candidatus Cloacimonas sp. SDB]|nr:MAG: hypothetical protein APR54_03825 [Candidatus Cloacimonas sp. SDB]
MKKFLIFGILLIILAGCTSEGDIKIFNRTQYPVYLHVKGNDYIIAGSEDLLENPVKKTVSVETGKEFLFWNGGDEKVKIRLEGETFMLQEADLSGNPTGIFYTETEILVSSNETTRIFCDPTHAGVKVINMTEIDIIYINVKKNGGNFIPLTTNTGSSADSLWYVAPADSVWARLEASTEDYPIFYEFQIILDDYQIFEIPAGEIETDEQYRLALYL